MDRPGHPLGSTDVRDGAHRLHWKMADLLPFGVGTKERVLKKEDREERLRVRGL
jgi:hypothetical protein